MSDRARLLLFLTIGSTDLELVAAVRSGAGGLFVPTSAVDLLARGAVRDAVEGLDRPPLVAVDEEGGRVQRLRSVIGETPSAYEMAEMEPADIRELARTHGDAMRSLGLTVDFAPVVDVVGDADLGGGGVIGDRSFSSDPAEVTRLAQAFAAGLADAGILPTYKHFPGHGRASGDSHHGLVTTPHIDDLGPELEPYEDLLGEDPVAAVMVGHLRVPGLTDGEPASVSPAAVEGLLRDQLGFDGLVVTDDLGGMQGILARYDTVSAAVLAVAAGVDMVLIPASVAEATVSALVAAVEDGRIADGRLSTSADRVLRAQQPGRC